MLGLYLGSGSGQGATFSQGQAPRPELVQDA